MIKKSDIELLKDKGIEELASLSFDDLVRRGKLLKKIYLKPEILDTLDLDDKTMRSIHERLQERCGILSVNLACGDSKPGTSQHA